MIWLSFRSLRQRFRRRAFTLLELLVSVVVIGILASLAIIKFGSAQEKAYTATMQSDLRNFATARALYMSESDQLPGSAAGVPGYNFSELVFEAGYQEDSATEWALLVGHNKTETRCALATYETGGGAHRIACAKEGSTSGGEESALAFFPSSSGNEVTVDASGPISQTAFLGSPAFAALNAASVAEIALISWEFGDGTVKSGSPSTHLQQTHTYTYPGSYTIQITLVKKTGEVATGESKVSIGGTSAPANQAPVASFTFSPTSVNVGNTVTFDGGASTDADGTIASWTWESAAWSPAKTGSTASHTFNTSGTFEVKLTVTDDRGATHSSTQVIVVAEPIAVVSSGLIFRDDFNRADGGPGANYEGNVRGSAVSGAQILSNRLRLSGGGGDVRVAVVSGVFYGSDVVFEADVIPVSGSSVGRKGYILNHRDDGVIQVQPYFDTGYSGIGIDGGNSVTNGASNLNSGRVTAVRVSLIGATARLWHNYADSNGSNGSPTLLATRAGGAAPAGRIAFRTWHDHTNDFDNLRVYRSHTVTVQNLPAGATVQVLNASSQVVASAAESGGTAAANLDNVSIPFDGLAAVQVLNSSGQTLATFAPATGVWGGDVYRYQ